MKSSIDISNLTPESIIFSLFVFASIISPGFLYFYLYHRDFFIEIDWLKLMFLSIGITAPFFILNLLAYSTLLAYRKNKEKEDVSSYFKSAFIMAAWATIVLFYLAMALDYFNFIFRGEELKPSSFLLGLLFAELFALTISGIQSYRYYLRHKKSKKTNTSSQVDT